MMKITKQYLVYSGLIFALFTLFVACNGTKKAPTISEIQSSRQQVKTGEKVDLYVDIESNPSSIPLKFDWSVTSGDGVVKPSSGSTKVTYQAPENEGIATVRLEVRGANDVIVATRTLSLQIIRKPLPVDSSKYGFESESDTMGWKRQTYIDSQAVGEVAQTTETSYCGSGSLKLTVNLIGKHENNSKGEAFVELRQQENLQGQTITAWIYAPAGSAGDFGNPNGVQVFVKDNSFRRSLYGTWTKILEGTWFEVSLTVSTTKPIDGYIDKDFDPQSIVMVGVKVAIGTGSNATYNGPIYVDAVDW